MSEKQDKSVNRRLLLRRAGTVAAGIAGTGVVGAVAASPAQAAPGDPVLQGQLNEAGASTTTLRNAAKAATLRLQNTMTWPGPDGTILSEPTLRLQPSGTTLHEQAEVGSIGMTSTGDLQVVPRLSGVWAQIDTVHTSGNSNRIVPITPQRVIDTRSSALRARIINRSGNLDSAGRVLAGRTIHISLEDFVFFGDAMFGNITVTGSLNPGFLTVFPYGVARPATSTTNYSTTQTVANAFMTGIGYTNDYISVYTQSTCHLFLDVVSFVVGVGQVNPAILPAPAASGLTAESVADRTAQRAVAAKQGKPSWK